LQKFDKPFYRKIKCLKASIYRLKLKNLRVTGM
jgi:hypothetical protein